MSELIQIPAAEHQNVTLTALRRMLSYGPALTAEERHDGYELLSVLQDLMQIDSSIAERIEAACDALRHGELPL